MIATVEAGVFPQKHTGTDLPIVKIWRSVLCQLAKSCFLEPLSESVTRGLWEAAQALRPASDWIMLALTVVNPYQLLNILTISFP